MFKHFSFTLYMYNSLQDNSALDWIIINFYLSFITHKFKIKVNNLNS